MPPPPPKKPTLKSIPRMPPPPLRALGPRTSVPGIPPAPVKRAEGITTLLRGSTRAKLEVASAALLLRHEQVRATVQYYGADQQTNAELDRITEAVVAELGALRLARERGRTSKAPDVEIEMMASLREALERLFSPQKRNFVERKIRDIQRRISQLFFDSELYAELAAESGEVKAAAWPEQALYFALRRHEQQLVEDLERMPVEEESVSQRAKDRLAVFMRQLCTDFLSRTTPELETILGIYREVLTEFFVADFAQSLGELSWAVIRESQVARGQQGAGKIDADKFPAFRAAYDKHFLEKLVLHTQGKITDRAVNASGERSEATLRFLGDPRIHSAICEVVNDSVYDYLHGEGFLDLPADWRRKLQRQSAG